MSSCDRAQSLFGRAWDDELTAAERDGLELHIKDCVACRREYDELARTLELVQTLPRPAVSDDFATRVLAEALRREHEVPAARRIFALPALPSFEISFGRPALALGRPDQADRSLVRRWLAGCRLLRWCLVLGA